MNTKLTLSLDRGIIEQAKEFARSQHLSLSKLIEDHLRKISKPKQSSSSVTPLVSKLSGILDANKVSDNKHEYADYLAGKYR